MTHLFDSFHNTISMCPDLLILLTTHLFDSWIVYSTHHSIIRPINNTVIMWHDSFIWPGTHTFESLLISFTHSTTQSLCDMTHLFDSFIWLSTHSFDWFDKTVAIGHGDYVTCCIEYACIFMRCWKRCVDESIVEVSVVKGSRGGIFAST